MSGGPGFLKNLMLGGAAQLLRLVPGSTALRWKRDLRDAAWLAQADAVVVSFPKSGRTFVRAMLARLFERRFGIDERALLEFPMLRRSRQVPRLLFTHAGDAMRTAAEIRVSAAEFAHAKVVLIARHPGDVAVSRYHHLGHRSRDKARGRLAAQPLDSFVWADQGGIPAIVTFLNRFAALPNVTIVRYEDFLADRAGTLSKLTAALGLDCSAAEISDAAEFGSFDNLKKLEQQGYFASSRLRPARKGDEQSSKVRKGKSGGYRMQLGKAEAARIDSYIDEHLDPVFGYSKPRARS